MHIRFWITLIRAALLMVLGLVLIFYPDKTRTILVNMMGIFWLTAGVVSLRWSLANREERGLPLIAGIIGVLIGLSVLTRWLTFRVGPESVIILAIATLVLVTGVLHLLRGFQTAETYSRVWSVENFLLGMIEIALAIILYITPSQGSVQNIPLTVWALVGGLVLISQALFLRRKTIEQGVSRAIRQSEP